MSASTIRNWVCQVKRSNGDYRALRPKSRRPKQITFRVPDTVVGIIFTLRHQLGWGGHRIAAELKTRGIGKVSGRTVYKIFDRLGFHAAILITGHYGPNYEDLKTLLDLIQPYVGTRLYGLPDFEANQPGFDNDGRSGGDHAGKVETSLLWALYPDCVDLSRLPSQDEPNSHFAMGPDAYDANRRVGERMVADEVRWLGAKAQELLEAYGREKPRHTLRTFEDVERLWATVVRPVMKDFLSMQGLWQDQEPPPEDSVWYEHWRVLQRGY